MHSPFSSISFIPEATHYKAANLLRTDFQIIKLNTSQTIQEKEALFQSQNHGAGINIFDLALLLM